MSNIISEIKSAIDSLDIDQARELLKVALKENPTSEVYYLASRVAVNETQKRSYLNKAIELDPFNEDAHNELKRRENSSVSKSPETSPKKQEQTALDINKFKGLFSTQNALARFLIIGVGIFVIFAIFNAWNTSNKRKQAEEFVNQANALLESGNYQEAITLYNQAIELDDSNYEVFYNCGIAYYKEDEFDRAIGSCQEAVKLNKSYALAHMCLGDSYSKKGDYQSAYSEYTETIKKDSDNAEAYIKRGVIAYLQFEDYAQAISDFTKVLDINPDATTVLKYRGFAYLNLEQYENAISDFTQYIDSTGDSTMYYTLGDIYYNNSDYKNAIEAYSNGLSFSDETIPEAYLFMAISYEEIGSVEQAIQNYNKYLDLDNGDNERTRYACSQVNSLTLNNSSNIFSFFFNALIPSCSRFRNSDGSNYTSNDTLDDYATPSESTCGGGYTQDECNWIGDIQTEQYLQSVQGGTP